MRLGVPLAFATDDEGVSFGNFTNEWIYGVEAYGLTGDDLVRLARASLQYSFIKGAPLWADLAAARPVAQCANIKFGIPQPPAPCQAYLDDNAKAKAQWAYEARLQTFLQSPLGRRLRSRLH
jgi:adenosine deaminase